MARRYGPGAQVCLRMKHVGRASAGRLIDAKPESVGYPVFIGPPTKVGRSFIPEARKSVLNIQEPNMSAVYTSTSPSSIALGRQATVPSAVRRGAWQLDAGHAMSLKA